MFTTAIFTLALAVCVFAVPAPAKVVTSCSVTGTAALTFDDGPSVYLKEVSDMLNATGAKGTFFLNGDNYLTRYPDGCIYHVGPANRVKYTYNAGHQIASHTWSHYDLTNLSRAQIDTEFARAEQAIQRITGASPAFTRPPYGEYNTLVRQVASARGQTLVNWDFDSGDAIGFSSARSERGYDRLVASRPRSILALNHDERLYTSSSRTPSMCSRRQGTDSSRSRNAWGDRPTWLSDRRALAIRRLGNADLPLFLDPRGATSWLHGRVIRGVFGTMISPTTVWSHCRWRVGSILVSKERGCNSRPQKECLSYVPGGSQ